MESDHREAANSLDNLLGYHLRRASSAVMAALHQSLAPLQLSVTEATTLMMIADNPGITQSEVGRRLSVQRANMAPLIAGLSARALVERSRIDGRTQGLRISRTGRPLVRAVRDRVATSEATLLPDLSPTSRAALIDQLRSIWMTAAAQAPR